MLKRVERGFVQQRVSEESSDRCRLCIELYGNLQSEHDFDSNCDSTLEPSLSTHQTNLEIIVVFIIVSVISFAFLPPAAATRIRSDPMRCDAIRGLVGIYSCRN